MREPMTMTGEYEASIRKADARACKGDQVPNAESLPGQRRALLDEVDHLRDRLDAAEKCIEAADEVRGSGGCGCTTCSTRRDSYDEARGAWRLRGGKK